jgi:hypothetical protein
VVGAFLSDTSRSSFIHNFLDTKGKRVGKVHVSGLLEATFADEAIDTVSWSGDVSDAVVKVEAASTVGLLLVEQLQTIVTYEDTDATTLALIGSDGLLERFNGGSDDFVE